MKSRAAAWASSNVVTGVAQRLGQHASLDRVRISPVGDFAVSSTWKGRGIRVWDALRRRLIKTLAPRWNSASIDVRPDGLQLIGVEGSEMAAWNTQSWEIEWRQQRNQADDWPGPVGFANDGRHFACMASRYIPQLSDSATGEPVAILEAPMTEDATGFSFSKDDRLLAIYNLRNIHVWDLQSVEQRLAELGLLWE